MNKKNIERLVKLRKNYAENSMVFKFFKWLSKKKNGKRTNSKTNKNK